MIQAFLFVTAGCCEVCVSNQQLPVPVAAHSKILVYDVGFWLLADWDCRFEYRQVHGSLSLLSVVCCQVEFSAVGPITRPEESYRLWCVSV